MYRPLASSTSDSLDPSGRWGQRESVNTSIVWGTEGECEHINSPGGGGRDSVNTSIVWGTEGEREHINSLGDRGRV